MTQCEKTRALIDTAADNELPNADAALVADHINDCSTCRAQWDAILHLRSGIAKIKSDNQPDPDFEKRIIAGLDKAIANDSSSDAAEGKPRNGVVRWIVMGTAAAIALTVAAASTFNLRPSFNERTMVGAERLIEATAHHSMAPSDPGIDVQYLGREPNLYKIAARTGFTTRLSKLGSFAIHGADVIDMGGDKTLLRLCYTPPGNDKICIDCYQAPKGMIAFKNADLKLIEGKPVQVATVAGQSAIMLSNNGVDLLYVSPLPQEKLLALVAPNV